MAARTGRRRAAGALAAAVILAGAGIAFALTIGGTDDAEGDDAEPAAATATAAVERRDLVVTESFDATLEFADSRSLEAGRGGVVTATPAVGAVVEPGQAVLAIDLEPTVLLAGSVPAFRALDTDSTDGPDIAQLEQALVDLGFGAGVTVDEQFTSSTADAVEAWEESLGRADPDGRVELGDVVFTSGALRVASIDAAVGDQVQSGSPVLTVTSVGKVVTMDFDAGRTGLLTVGATVGLTMPDDSETTGTIASIGTATTTESTATQPGATATEDSTVPVVVAIDDTAAAAGIDSGSVEVALERSRADAVLAVPTTALLALAEGGYALQVVDGSVPGGYRLVAVETGTFADGWVEVTGDGVEAGLDVVVPR